MPKYFRVNLKDKFNNIVYPNIHNKWQFDSAGNVTVDTGNIKLKGGHIMGEDDKLLYVTLKTEQTIDASKTFTKHLFLGGINSGADTCASKIIFGTKTNFYSRIAGDTNGLIALYNKDNDTTKAVIFDPNNNTFRPAYAGNKIFSLGLDNARWNSFYGTTANFAGDITINSNGATGWRGIIGAMADNDRWYIGGAGSSSDNGYMMIASGDNGNEPIYVRQYKDGNPPTGTINRTLTLLDSSGNTTFPGNLIMTGGKHLKVNSNAAAKFVPTSGCGICSGQDQATTADANIRIYSWYGIGFTPSIASQTIPQGENAVYINVRNGQLFARGTITAPTFSGTATKATADASGNTITSTYKRVDGINQYITFTTGGANNEVGYRKILEQTLTAWKNCRLTMMVNSRHQGNGMLCVSISLAGTLAEWTGQVVYFGDTVQYTSPFRAFYNPANGLFRLFYHHSDYSSCKMTIASINGFNYPSNGAWSTSIPSSGTELGRYQVGPDVARNLGGARYIRAGAIGTWNSNYANYSNETVFFAW